MAFPSEADQRQTKNLTDVLHSYDIFESHIELQHREKVLKYLETIYKKWLRDTCCQMNMPESVTDQVGGRVVPFGSFTLGVHTRCSDIDVLCVGPEFVERHDFFSSFYEKMKSLREVQNIRVNPMDRLHRMPIITPTYPYQNSAYNRTASTLTVMKDEIKRGRNIAEAVYENRASWRKLFERPTFVQDYRHYIVLTATAATQTQQQEWAPYVESRIRLLVGRLDRNVYISLAHPSTQSFPGKDGLSTKWLIGVQLNQCGPKTLNLASDLQTFSQIVYSQSGSLYKDRMKVSAAFTPCEHLSSLLLDGNVPDIGQSNKAQAKRRACSPADARFPKKVRVEPTPGKFITPNKESVAASVCPSTKRHRTPEHDPEVKRFKQELRPSPVELLNRTPAHTRTVVVKRAPFSHLFK